MSQIVNGGLLTMYKMARDPLVFLITYLLHIFQVLRVLWSSLSGLRDLKRCERTRAGQARNISAYSERGSLRSVSYVRSQSVVLMKGHTIDAVMHEY